MIKSFSLNQDSGIILKTKVETGKSQQIHTHTCTHFIDIIDNEILDKQHAVSLGLLLHPTPFGLIERKIILYIMAFQDRKV